MNVVLSEAAHREFHENGYIRPHIRLPAELLQRMQAHFDGIRVNNWECFRTCDVANQPTYNTWFHRLKKYRYDRKSKQYSRDKYHKAIFDSSPFIPEVVGHCVAHGLGDALGPIPFLLNHDVYLEADAVKKPFDIHEDTWMTSVFYNTDDDLSLFIPFHDVNEQTGGRLCVERDQEKFTGLPELNFTIHQLAEHCRRLGAVDEHGRVTRDAILNSPHLIRLQQSVSKVNEVRRSVMPEPTKEEVFPMDAKAGEVLIFNNKRYHGVEDWRADFRRRVYVIRLVPLYDIGLHPPSTFLDDRPCNLHIYNAGSGVIRPISCDTEPLPYIGIPPARS